MKYKVSTFLLFGITIILCFNNLNLRQTLRKEISHPRIVGKTDTVYITKPFKAKDNYSTQVLPNYVFLYGNTRSEQKPRVIQTASTASSLESSNLVLEEDSFVQLLLDKDKLDLSFFNKLSNNFHTNQFKLDLDHFKYNWVNGTLTKEKIKSQLRVSPYVYTKYRYFNNMVDIGGGITLKTQHILYKIGLNGFYYPKLCDSPKMDVEFCITYN